MMEIKRGYVKWTDSSGVFHKEPLIAFPDMFDDATEKQQQEALEVAENIGWEDEDGSDDQQI
jgi:hypothetical protein